MRIFAIAFVFFAFWIFQALSTIFFMHMFQLNTYRADDQWHWMIKNRGRMLPLLLPAVGGIIGVICGGNAALIISGAAMLLAALYYKPRAAKKPLKYTPRVKRMLVTIGVIYVLTAILLAVFASVRVMAAVLCTATVLSPLVVIAANVINKPIELSINRYYTNDAKKILASCPNLTVIGVTGSYGKTSVK